MAGSHDVCARLSAAAVTSEHPATFRKLRLARRREKSASRSRRRGRRRKPADRHSLSILDTTRRRLADPRRRWLAGPPRCLHSAFAAEVADEQTFDEQGTLKAVTTFGRFTDFARRRQGLQQRLAERLHPRRGVAAAVTAGVRYGEGDLVLQVRRHQEGLLGRPSVGFGPSRQCVQGIRAGLQAADVQAIFKRYPGVDGSLYYIGGVGVSYQRLDGVTLAPIRLGAEHAPARAWATCTTGWRSRQPARIRSSALRCAPARVERCRAVRAPPRGGAALRYRNQHVVRTVTPRAALAG